MDITCQVYLTKNTQQTLSSRARLLALIFTHSKVSKFHCYPLPSTLCLLHVGECSLPEGSRKEEGKGKVKISLQMHPFEEGMNDEKNLLVFFREDIPGVV